MIAYGLVTGGRIALTQLAAQVGVVAQRYSMQSAGQAATGNMNLATMGAYSSSLFQHNSAPSHHSGTAAYTDPGSGVSYSINQSGTYANIPQNQLPISGSVESAVHSGISHQLSQKVAQLVEGFKTSHGLSNQQKAGLLAGASVALTVPNPGIDIQGRTSLELNSDAAHKEVWAQALDYAKRTNFGEHYEQAINAGHRATASESERSGDRFSEQVSDQLSRELQQREQLTATVTPTDYSRDQKTFEAGFNKTVEHIDTTRENNKTQLNSVEQKNTHTRRRASGGGRR